MSHVTYWFFPFCIAAPIQATAGSQLLPQTAAYSGVARVNAEMSCTGFWLQTVDKPTAPAYLLTNGHCVQARIEAKMRRKGRTA